MDRSPIINVKKVHILLLTGLPGIGKTAVIRALPAMISNKRIGGFYTQEIRLAGNRQGFRLISFNHVDTVIAHIDFSGTHRVGKYGVDIAAIDQAAEQTLCVNPAIEVYLVDEIGKMECLSSRFVTAMRTLLNSEKPVVATIGKKGGGFMDEVKRRKDVELWEISHDNRDNMPDRILDWLATH